jgi:hypothetical protein
VSIRRLPLNSCWTSLAFSLPNAYRRGCARHRRSAPTGFFANVVAHVDEKLAPKTIERYHEQAHPLLA